MQTDQLEVTCGPRYFRNHQEYRRWFEIRSKGFSEWYVPPDPGWSLGNNRHVANCKAALFPDFFHQLRTGDGAAVGYLATVPGYWSGSAESLQNLEYIDETLQLSQGKMLALTAFYVVCKEWLGLHGLFERIANKVRASRMSGANVVYLIAISVDPAYRKHKLPTLLLGAAKDAARKLGYDHVVAPFRPNAYGAYKAERRLTHSDALFQEYCAQTNADGLPLDPWLRTVVRQGARLLRPMARSLAIKGSLAKFDRLRKNFRPRDWYSPVADVWECGETCTWYVDRARRLAISAEANYWGVFDLRDPAANDSAMTPVINGTLAAPQAV
jgi:GNAT superfamily N-acetyltransferase